jgi:hypothetical protein
MVPWGGTLNLSLYLLTGAQTPYCVLSSLPSAPYSSLSELPSPRLYDVHSTVSPSPAVEEVSAVPGEVA